LLQSDLVTQVRTEYLKGVWSNGGSLGLPCRSDHLLVGRYERMCFFVLQELWLLLYMRQKLWVGFGLGCGQGLLLHIAVGQSGDRFWLNFWC
jgi:hypothetical protein